MVASRRDSSYTVHSWSRWPTQARVRGPSPAQPAVERFVTRHDDVAGERRERLAGEDEEVEGPARAHARDGLQQEVDALAVAQVGRVHHEDFVAEAELTADDLGRAAGRARSEEVVDDLDRAVEVEHALGFALERLGHGGDRGPRPPPARCGGGR